MEKFLYQERLQVHFLRLTLRGRWITLYAFMIIQPCSVCPTTSAIYPPFVQILPCMPVHFKGFIWGDLSEGGDLETSQSGTVQGTNALAIAGAAPVSATVPSQLLNNQFQGMAYLGYGSSWQRKYLGAEVFAQAAAHNKLEGNLAHSFLATGVGFNTQQIDFTSTVKTSSIQFGGDLRPGILVTPLTLLYGRVGVSAAKIHTHVDVLNSTNSSNVETFSVPGSFESEAWKAAFRLGLGLEYLLTLKLHLRADYIHTNYGILSFSKNATSTGSSGSTVFVSSTLSDHVKNNTVLVGLTYYFR